MTKQLCQYGPWRRDPSEPTGIRYVGEGCNHEARWRCWANPGDRNYSNASYSLLCASHARAFGRLRLVHGDVERFSTEEYLARNASEPSE